MTCLGHILTSTPLVWVIFRELTPPLSRKTHRDATRDATGFHPKANSSPLPPSPAGGPVWPAHAPLISPRRPEPRSVSPTYTHSGERHAAYHSASLNNRPTERWRLCCRRDGRACGLPHTACTRTPHRLDLVNAPCLPLPGVHRRLPRTFLCTTCTPLNSGWNPSRTTHAPVMHDASITHPSPARPNTNPLCP